MSLKLVFNELNNTKISIRAQYGWSEELYQKFFSENFMKFDDGCYLYIDWGNVVSNIKLYSIIENQNNINIMSDYLMKKQLSFPPNDFKEIKNIFLKHFVDEHLITPNIVETINRLEHYNIEIEKHFKHFVIKDTNTPANYIIIIPIKELEEVHGIKYTTRPMQLYFDLKKKVTHLFSKPPFYLDMYIDDVNIEIPEISGVHKYEIEDLLNKTKSKFNEYISNYVYYLYKENNPGYSGKALLYIKHALLEMFPENIPDDDFVNIVDYNDNLQLPYDGGEYVF